MPADSEPSNPEGWGEELQEPQTEEQEVDPRTDPRYIRVESWEYVKGQGVAEGFNLATGRKISTYRLRTPEEAGMEWTEGPPIYPIPLEEPKTLPKEDRRTSDWQPGLHPKMLKKMIDADKSDEEDRAGSGAMGLRRWSGFAHRDSDE